MAKKKAKAVVEAKGQETATAAQRETPNPSGKRVRATRTSRKSAAPVHRRRTKRSKRYSDEQRRKILDTAQREGLTGSQVEKRFGVSTVTYYLWRKRDGSRRGRVGRSTTRGGSATNSSLAAQVRQEIQARIRAMLPEIVRSEVQAVLGPGLGAARRRAG